MKRKTLVALFMVLIMALSLVGFAGCNQSEDSSSANTGSGSSNTGSGSVSKDNYYINFTAHFIDETGYEVRPQVTYNYDSNSGVKVDLDTANSLLKGYLYDAKGFYKDTDFTTEYKESDITKETPSSQTVYVKCVKRAPKIFLNANGGKLKDNITSYERTIVSSPTCSKTGYVLYGWYYDSEMTYEANFPLTVYEDTELYAKLITVAEAAGIRAKNYIKLNGLKDKNTYSVRIYQDTWIDMFLDYDSTDDEFGISLIGAEGSLTYILAAEFKWGQYTSLKGIPVLFGDGSKTYTGKFDVSFTLDPEKFTYTWTVPITDSEVTSAVEDLTCLLIRQAEIYARAEMNISLVDPSKLYLA